MKKSQNQKELLLLLLQNSIVQFIVGTLSISIILILANSIEANVPQILLKSFGYSFYYYLTTPFIIYWLAYASAKRLNRTRLSLTIVITAIYSYFLWDSYFFFTEAMNLLLSKIN